MPRKYAVLHQFSQDFDRLLTEAEGAFATLQASENASQSEILAVFRPIHSLKGICGMVDEAKLLVHVFHQLEDVLPPLLPVRPVKGQAKVNLPAIGKATFQIAREVDRIIRMKLLLWKQLGADENESRGLVVAFRSGGETQKLWVPITSLLGLAHEGEPGVGAEGLTFGTPGATKECLLVEAPEGAVTVFIDEIVSMGTRLDAVQGGVPYCFKEWWNAFQKSSTRRAA